jgi:hypothetical protein
MALAWLVPSLALFAGWIAWSRLPRAPEETEDLLEGAFATVLCGVFIAGLLGLLLAELGFFRPSTLASALGGVGLALWWMLPSRVSIRRVSTLREVGSALLCLVLAAATVAPASEDLLGGRDPGVYMNTGSWLAREGTLRIRAEALASIPDEPRQLFFARNDQRPQIFLLGFFVVGDGASGEITPQFLHLLPVYLAIGYWLGGPAAAFLVPPFFGVLAVLAVFIFTRRMLGLGAAVAAAALLSLNLAQVWGTRNPFTEGATQLGVFALLWCIKRGFDTRGPRWGVLGSVALGTCFLLRVDALLVLAAVMPALVLLQATSPQRWLTRAFLPIAILLALWGTAHGWLFSQPYMRDLRTLLTALWTLTAVVLTLCIPGFWTPGRVASLLERMYRRGRTVWAAGALTLSAAFAYGMWVRAAQAMPSFDDEALVRVGWYFSRAGMLIAVAGVVLIGYRWLVQRRVDWTPFLFSLLAFSCLYFWRQMISPDHPWAMRRYLPVIVPGICVGIAAVADALWSRPSRMRYAWRAAAAVVLLAVAWHEIGMTRRFWSFTEKSGALAAVQRIAQAIPADALILFTRPGYDVLVATPLAMHHGRSVLPVLRRSAEEAQQDERRRLFEAQMGRWMRDRREVFYLTAEDGDAPYATLDVRWQPVAMPGVTVHTFGASEKHPPGAPTSYYVQYHVVRAVEHPDVLPACAPRALRADTVLLGMAEGFSQLETRQPVRYRWVRPRARLVFPKCERVTSRPRVLRVRASCGARTPGATCEVTVDVNGASAGRLRLTDQWRIVDLAIPDTAASAPTGAFDVRFSGPRFVEAEAGIGTGRREVSFRLASVALVPGDIPGGGPSGGGGVSALPADLNLISLAAQDIWAVRQDGFYEVEQPDGRMFRWTGRQARVIVPLGRSRPSAVRVDVSRTIQPGHAIRIRANACLLFDGVPPQSEWNTVLSLDGCPITGDELIVTIEGKAIRPLPDRRELAVAVRSIRLE